MDFGEVLKKAWKIIWKFKVLWIFGILSSCGQSGGGSGGSSANSSAQYNGSDGANVFNGNLPPFLQNIFNSFERGFESGAIWIWIIFGVLALICLSFILSFLFTAISSVGKIGLVRGTWLADEGAEKLRFGELLQESFKYFWRVFLFQVVLSILGFILVMLLILPIILLTVFTLGCGLILLIPILIAVGWFINVWKEQTIVAIVGEDLSLMDGVKRAWEVITTNLVSYLVMAAILFIGSFIVGLIIALPIIFTIIPGALAIGVGLYNETTALVGTGIALFAAMCCLLVPLTILLGGILQSYLGAAWALTFRRLTGKLPARENVEP